jgi:uncharacterized membrane protein
MDEPERRPSASVQLAAVGAVGLVAAVVVGVLGWPMFAPLIGWDVAAVTYLTWVWATIWRLDADATARLAVREDPARAVADVLLLVACVASLLAVFVILATASARHSTPSDVRVFMTVFSVLVSWAVIHTIYTTRYARIYYSGADGGIDFHQAEPPCYADFAYTSFTIGMTFQVSDSDLTSAEMRRQVLRHSLLSYLFGAVIIAGTINLVAGLAK